MGARLEQPVQGTISRSLAAEVTVFLTAFVAIAIVYAAAEGVAAGGYASLAGAALWAVLGALCWMRYKFAFLVTSIWGVLGTMVVFATAPSSIQYDVIANYLVIPFSLRAYRELSVQGVKRP